MISVTSRPVFSGEVNGWVPIKRLLGIVMLAGLFGNYTILPLTFLPLTSLPVPAELGDTPGSFGGKRAEGAKCEVVAPFWAKCQTSSNVKDEDLTDKDLTDDDRQSQRRVIILVVDNIDLSDLANPDLPNIGQILREGSVGLMNTVTRGRRGDVSAYCSIGAGARTAGSTLPARLTLSHDEDLFGVMAPEAYSARMGESSVLKIQDRGGVSTIHGVSTTPGASTALGASTAPSAATEPSASTDSVSLASVSDGEQEGQSGISPIAPITDSTPTDPLSSGSSNPEPSRSQTHERQYKIFNLGLIPWLKENANLGYSVTLGAMCTALREAGLLWALIGNSDSPQEPFRPSIGIAMDDTGRVPLGEIGDILNKVDPRFPGGIRTDWSAMQKAYREVEDEASVIVIECGDTNRIAAIRTYLRQEQEMTLLVSALRETDAFIGWLTPRLDSTRDLLVLLSPNASSSTSDLGDSFAPVVIRGSEFPHGLLTSPTTRTSGLIANIDIAPTVLEHLKVSKKERGACVPMFGRAAETAFDISGVTRGETLGSFDPVTYLLRFHQASLSNHIIRPSIIRAFVTMYVLTLVLIVIFIQLNRPVPGLLKVFLIAMPLFPAYLPLLGKGAHMLLSLQADHNSLITRFLEKISPGITYDVPSWVLIALLATLLSTVTANLILRVTRGEVHFTSALSFLSIAGFIVWDQLSGYGLTANTPFGHSLVAGARFYGMGNEYMGLVVGAGIMAASCLSAIMKTELFRWVIFAFIFSSIVAAVSLPYFGANFGGGITAVAGFVLTIWFCQKQTVLLVKRDVKGIRGAVYALALTGAAIAIITVLNFALDKPAAEITSTHVGLTLSLAKSLGVKEVFGIYARKMQMNLKLIKYSIWTKALLSSIVTFVVIAYRSRGASKTIQEYAPRLMGGVKGACVAGLTALLSNDSGVVAAAMILISASSAFLYAASEEHDRNQKNVNPDAKQIIEEKRE